MSVRPDSAYLADIQEAIRRIGGYTADMPYEQFRKDIRTQDAVMRNLEIIGEATKNISASFRKKTFRHSLETNGRSSGQTYPPLLRGQS